MMQMKRNGGDYGKVEIYTLSEGERLAQLHPSDVTQKCGPRAL